MAGVGEGVAGVGEGVAGEDGAVTNLPWETMHIEL